MYTRYNSHHDATFSPIEDTSHHFHTFKDVFLLGRARKKIKAKPNALGTELLKKWKVEEETNGETRTPSMKRREMNAWHDYISHEIGIYKEWDADFNFPKIHLMPHWGKHIRRYGALQQYSANRHEQAYKTNLKDGWNDSNYNLSFLPQVITFPCCILCFEIRELNVQRLAQRRENSADSGKVLLSGADLATPQSPQPYGKPEFIGLQNRSDGPNADARILDFRALLDMMLGTTHHAAVYSRKQ